MIAYSKWDQGFEELEAIEATEELSEESSVAVKLDWVTQSREESEALAYSIEAATSAEELITVSRTFFSHVLADRLDDILEPIDPYSEEEDPEEEDSEEARMPKILVDSLRNFLRFCAKGAPDGRYMPSRSFIGEIGLQFLDHELGDLAIKFRADGEVWLALVSDDRSGSIRCPASDLLTPRDPYVVSRWL